MEKEGINELIKISFEKSQKAIYPAFVKSIKEKIIQIFTENTATKKNRLKKDLKEISQKILNEIKEDEKIENSISKLSTIIEKTLNIFFEITTVTENSKNDIKTFLDDLCKWSIGRLNEIMDELVKDNAKELSILLLNEQTKVKKKHNVDGTLSNEKTYEEFIAQSEHDLKPDIINKVYFLAIKDIYKIISDNIVEMSEEIMKEEFNQIVPKLRNYISDEKLKQLSNQILEEIIKNKQ